MLLDGVARGGTRHGGAIAGSGGGKNMGTPDASSKVSELLAHGVRPCRVAQMLAVEGFDASLDGSVQWRA
jgi:hypothetical protein